MNKSDLIKSISDSTGLKQTEATRLVDAVFDTITSNLETRRTGRDLRLRHLRRQDTRRARGPQPCNRHDDQHPGQNIGRLQAGGGDEGSEIGTEPSPPGCSLHSGG